MECQKSSNAGSLVPKGIDFTPTIVRHKVKTPILGTMRIGIREQLGLLVLLATLIALAVVAVATVISNSSSYAQAPYHANSYTLVGHEL